MSQQTVKTTACAACGAPTSKSEERCSHCGSWLVHLSRFEQRKRGKDAPVDKETAKLDLPKGSPFRSLRPLYQAFLFAGVVSVVYLYGLAFDQVDQGQLVMLAPVWFLSLNFGLAGYFGEKAMSRVLKGEAEGFIDGFEGPDTPVALWILLMLFTLPPLLFYKIQNRTSPLKHAVYSTIVWGCALAFFLVFFFPVF